MNSNTEDKCICKGNWRALVAEMQPLLDRKFRRDIDGTEWTFFGLVYGSDDYYYGMYRPGDMRLLSCVGTMEACGYTLIEEPTPKGRQPHRCNTAYPMNSSAVGEAPCSQCGWPICEHPIRDSK